MVLVSQELLILIFQFRYMEGGIESGFVKVDRNAYTKRLLHVKGKRNIRIEQVFR